MESESLRGTAGSEASSVDMEKNYDSKKSPSEAQRRAFYVQAISWIPVGWIVLAILGGVMLSGTVILSRDVEQVRTKLATFEGRIQYVLGYQVWGVLCLALAILNVAGHRSSTQAYSPLWRTLEEHPGMVTSKQLLASSVEFFLCSVIAQLAAIVYLDAEWTIRIIPFMAVTYVLGRIGFWAGYPNRRSAGMAILAYPIFALIGYDLVSFFIHIH